MLKRRIKGIFDLDAAMRGENRLAKVALTVFCFALVMTSFSYATEWAGDSLEGTWLPDQGSKNHYTYLYEADGKISAYSSPAAKEPSLTGRYDVERKWSDAKGNTWYQVQARWPSGLWYVLMKISPSGVRMESQANQVAYPEELQPDSPMFGIHRRE
ncbi:MAG TPA: hypothetical protein VMV83_05880 [Rectinemataceae bacterium]|nr:hypothetical protein [Rectinemataceae bacterium]